MTKSRTISVFALGLIMSMTLSGCLNALRYNGPCRVPNGIDSSDLIGTWQIRYRNYDNPNSPSSPITGIETLIINADGTYSQQFQSDTYNYVGEVYQWSLVLDEGDGPKLQMMDLVYFTDGIEQKDGPLVLSLQMPDQLRFQDLYPNRDERTTKIVVNYPDDGFVYLYPRHCFDKFVLLQMVSDSGDPDDLTVHNPVYERIR